MHSPGVFGRAHALVAGSIDALLGTTSLVAVRRSARLRPWQRRAKGVAASLVSILLVAGGMIGSASVASAATDPAMTWTMHTQTNPVTSGTRASWEVDIECSALAAPEDCANPVLTLTPPTSVGGSVVAGDPQAQASFITEFDAADDGSATVHISAMTPGSSRSFVVSWLVPNYTVVPGTELTPGGSLSYEAGCATAGPVAPSASDDMSTITQADPHVQVTKVLSSDAATAAPGHTATYTITVCLPSDTPGQLDISHLKVVDTLTVSPAEDEGSEATFTAFDGGTLDATARAVTWDITVSADDPRPLCGSGDEIVKTVSITFPAGMAPAQGQDPRLVTNNATTTATMIDGRDITGDSSVIHTFGAGSATGGAPFVAVQLPADPEDTVKGAMSSPFTWSDWISLGGSAVYDSDVRGLTALESLPCMSNRDGNNLPSTRDLSVSGFRTL